MTNNKEFSGTGPAFYDPHGIDDWDDPVACPACGGDGQYLDRLGDLEWFRCRHCGIDFNCSVPPTEPDPDREDF